jgi:transcriptional regulator with XRE-family HTH domain
VDSLPVPTDEPSRAQGAEEPQPHEIGQRLAALRRQRGIKVSALAREVGVSPSLVSQIERGQSRPSVSTLFGLAEALRVPVDAFLRDHEPDALRDPGSAAQAQEDSTAARRATRNRYLVRRRDRDVIEIEGGVRWESLTPRQSDDLEFLELVYAPNAQSSPTLYRHPGEEMVLVLSGQLDIYVGFERFRLEPGDSIEFPSSMPHRYVNPTDETVRAVTVIRHDYPPADRSQDPHRRP